MLDRVGERLANDEVRARRDMRRDGQVAQIERDPNRRAPGERLERSREAFAAYRADSVGQVPQLDNRGLELVDARIEYRLDGRIG